jgi:hypothetical protein
MQNQHIIHHRESSDESSDVGWYQKTWYILHVRIEMASSREVNARNMYVPAAGGAWNTLHDIRPHYTCKALLLHATSNVHSDVGMSKNVLSSRFFHIQVAGLILEDATVHGHADGFLGGRISSMWHRQTDDVLYETVRAPPNESVLCKLSDILHMCNGTASLYRVEGHH